MLFSTTDSLADIWQTLLHELHRGALDPKHPFRYLTVATIGEQFPQVRTVVLRQFTADLEFLVYTDARSSKVQELLEVPRVSLLFYHPKKEQYFQFYFLQSGVGREIYPLRQRNWVNLQFL